MTCVRGEGTHGSTPGLFPVRVFEGKEELGASLEGDVPSHGLARVVTEVGAGKSDEVSGLVTRGRKWTDRVSSQGV